MRYNEPDHEPRSAHLVSAYNARYKPDSRKIIDKPATAAKERTTRLANHGKVRPLVLNGQWTSGCTAERPKGWERMPGIREVEAV